MLAHLKSLFHGNIGVSLNSQHSVFLSNMLLQSIFDASSPQRKLLWALVLELAQPTLSAGWGLKSWSHRSQVGDYSQFTSLWSPSPSVLLDENSHAQPLFSCTAIRDIRTIMYNTVNNSTNIALFANHAMAFLCVSTLMVSAQKLGWPCKSGHTVRQSWFVRRQH